VQGGGGHGGSAVVGSAMEIGPDLGPNGPGRFGSSTRVVALSVVQASRATPAPRGCLRQQSRAWQWRPSPLSEVVGGLVVDLWISHLAPATSWGGATASENRASTSVKPGDGGV
jgi:hypothetical protein